MIQVDKRISFGIFMVIYLFAENKARCDCMDWGVNSVFDEHLIMFGQAGLPVKNAMFFRSFEKRAELNDWNRKRETGFTERYTLGADGDMKEEEENDANAICMVNEMGGRT